MIQSTPTLQELLLQAIESRVTDIHVALPAIVQKYDATKQTCEVQPCIKKKYSDNTVVNLPLITNVPVVFPRTSKAYLHIPLKKNDYVLLIFCERSLDIFMQKGGIVDPEDYRKHNLSDAVAIAGLFPQGTEIQGATDKVDLVNDLAKISLEESGITRIGKTASTPSENVVLGLVLQQYLKDLHTKIDALMDIIITGDFLLVTSPGNPTAPNPVKVVNLTQIKTDLLALKTSPISDKLFLSDVFFTEKGNS
jgi:hypothetical protein